MGMWKRLWKSRSPRGNPFALVTISCSTTPANISASDTGTRPGIYSIFQTPEILGDVQGASKLFSDTSCRTKNDIQPFFSVLSVFWTPAFAISYLPLPSIPFEDTVTSPHRPAPGECLTIFILNAACGNGNTNRDWSTHRRTRSC